MGFATLRIAFATALAVTIGGGVAAQGLGLGIEAEEPAETTPPAPETPPAEDPPAEAPAAPVDGTGEGAEIPVPDVPAGEAAVDITAFQDWELRCERGTSNCFMYQLARNSANNPVAEISIVALPDQAEGAAGATVVTPLGSLLTEGLVIQIDDEQARQYPFNWCNRSGCYARFGLRGEEIAAMQRGDRARMRVISVSAPDQPVILEVSLSGFTAAFNALNTNK
ncbi:MAG: invasion associated locus B family protein [Pseudomonadota bacterium]